MKTPFSNRWIRRPALRGNSGKQTPNSGLQKAVNPNVADESSRATQACGRGSLSRKVKVYAAVSLLFFALKVWAASSASDSSKKWNVVLISIDTLRADHVGAYGYSPSITPNFDRLAKEGVLFEHVYTPVPLTLPAHTSLLTGEYPYLHGVRDNGEALSESVPTLAPR